MATEVGGERAGLLVTRHSAAIPTSRDASRMGQHQDALYCTFSSPIVVGGIAQEKVEFYPEYGCIKIRIAMEPRSLELDCSRIEDIVDSNL
jgi:hypothetical protein